MPQPRSFTLGCHHAILAGNTLEFHALAPIRVITNPCQILLESSKRFCGVGVDSQVILAKPLANTSIVNLLVACFFAQLEIQMASISSSNFNRESSIPTFSPVDSTPPSRLTPCRTACTFLTKFPSYQHHGAYTQHHQPTLHHPFPCRLTTYRSSSRGSGNSSSSSSSILLQPKARAHRILATRARCKSGDTAATRPQGDINDFNSSTKKDRQTLIKVTIGGPSSPPPGEHGTVGKRNSPVIEKNLRCSSDPPTFCFIAEVEQQHASRERSY